MLCVCVRVCVHMCACADGDARQDAEEEIFKLMERDAFARFKGNEEAVKSVVDDFFAGADATHDGYISFAEYRTWVLQQPQVIVFFTQLAQSILALLRTAPAKGFSARAGLGDITLELPPAPLTNVLSPPVAF